MTTQSKRDDEALAESVVDRLDHGDATALLDYLEAAGGKNVGPATVRVKRADEKRAAAAG